MPALGGNKRFICPERDGHVAKSVGGCRIFVCFYRIAGCSVLHVQRAWDETIQVLAVLIVALIRSARRSGVVHVLDRF